MLSPTIFAAIIHIVLAKIDPGPVIFCAVIHRHGDRSPLREEMYPNDPYLNYPWHGGYGALSPGGARQLYDLGRTLGLRYAHLLPDDGLYSDENMHVSSSAEKRCLNSVQNLLAGFMPPKSQSNTLPIAWQSVPVSYKPTDQDTMLYPKKPCAKYDELHDSLLYNPAPDTDIYAFNKQNADLYEYLTFNTGKNVSDCYQGELLSDILLIEQDSLMKLPNWTDPVFPSKVLSLSARSQALLTETQYMKRIKGGPLISQICEEMLLKQENNETRNLFFYSGHDLTLTNVMRALEVQDQTSPTPLYGAAFIFELRRAHETLESYVDLLYFESAEATEPIQISIPNCTHPCSLNDFIKVYEDRVFIVDFDAECQSDQRDQNNTNLLRRRESMSDY